MTRNRPAVVAAVAVLSVTVPAVATADGSTALEPTVEDRDGGVAVIVTGDGSAVAGTTVTVRPSTASSPVTTAPVSERPPPARTGPYRSPNRRPASRFA